MKSALVFVLLMSASCILASCILEEEESQLLVNVEQIDDIDEFAKDPVAAVEKGDCHAEADCGDGDTIFCEVVGTAGGCNFADTVPPSLQITASIISCYPDYHPHGRYEVSEVGGSRGFVECNGSRQDCPAYPAAQSFQWSVNYGTLDEMFPDHEVHHHASSSYPFTLEVEANDGRIAHKSYTPNGPMSCDPSGGGGGGPF